MKDRVSLYPNRYRLTPVSGQDNTYDLTRADEPLEVGTPLNKATMLDETMATKFKLTDETGTPNNAFAKVDDRIDRIDHYRIGDIRVSVSRDLGKDYLLANGAEISSDDYPELCEFPSIPYVVQTVRDTSIEENGWMDAEDAIYADGKWVLAGILPYTGRIAYTDSLDKGWTINETFTYSDYITSIGHGNGVWVVGTKEWNDVSAHIEISTDLNGSFDYVTLPSNVRTYGVGSLATDNNGNWIGTINGSVIRIIYSTDNASSWSSLDAYSFSGSTARVNKVIHLDGKWVAIGDRHISTSSTNARPFLIYADAINGNWTANEFEADTTYNYTIRDVVAADGKVIVKTYYENAEGIYVIRLYVFSNGITDTPSVVEFETTTNSSGVVGQIIYVKDKWMMFVDDTIYEATDPLGEWTSTVISTTAGSYFYTVALTDGETWMSSVYAYDLNGTAYITRDLRKLPTVSTDGAYTYIKVKESNNDYR